MSSQHPHLTANEKHKERAYHACNGGFPCGINGFQLFLTDAARRTPSGQGERQTKGRLVARMPNSQGHRETRRVLNSNEDTGSGQESAEWLREWPEIRQMFSLDCHSYFWPFNAILAILRHFKSFNAILAILCQLFATWHDKKYAGKKQP